MTEITSVGNWIRRRRKALDLTQVRLAEHVGCAVITIKKIEGDERRPSTQMASLLADHLAIPQEEQETFFRMARGEWVQNIKEPAPVFRPPAFLTDPGDEERFQKARFVGRESELNYLQARLEESLHRKGQVVFVTGDAGRGKSALLAEFALRSQAKYDSLLSLFGTCQALSGIGDPFLPFREILEMLSGDVNARWATGSISAEQARRLWRFGPQFGRVLVEQSPDLIDFLIPGEPLLRQAQAREPDATDWLQRLSDATKSAAMRSTALEQQFLFEQTVRLIQACALRQPMLIMLDDLQWADHGTLSLLFHLGRRIQGNRILIVAACRPDVLTAREDDSRHPLGKILNEFKRTFGNITVDLALSDDQDGRAFVDALLDSEPNQLSERFREQLHRHTGGHPLFTVEFLRALQEQRVLVKDGNGRWIKNKAIEWHRMPARVEGVIAERIERLPQEHREILRIASVEGERFTAEVVAQILYQDERHIFRQLGGRLSGHLGLIRELDETSIGSRYLTHYQFRHSLFQKYIYNQLSRGERRLIHGHIVSVLQSLYPESHKKISLSLAHHCVGAGKLLEAVPYLQQAGDRARRRYDHENAIGIYQRALTLLNLHDKDGQLSSTLSYSDLDDLMAMKADDVAENLLINNDPFSVAPQTECDLRLGLGECLLRVGASSEAVMAQFNRCVTIAPDDQRRAEAYFHLGQALHIFSMSDLSTAESHYSKALALLNKMPDTEQYGRILANLGYLYRYQGKHEQSAATLEKALTIARRLAARPLIAETLIYLGGSYLSLELEEKAEDAAREGLEIAEALGSLELMGRGHSFLADIALQRAFSGEREPEAALPHLQEMIRYGRDYDIKILAGFGAGGMANYAELIGDIPMALDALKEAAQIFRDADTGQRAAGYEVYRGQLLLKTGQSDEAAKAFAQVRLDCGPNKARAEFLVGRAHAREGNTTQAIEQIKVGFALLSEAKAHDYWLNLITSSPYWEEVRIIPQVATQLESEAHRAW